MQRELQVLSASEKACPYCKTAHNYIWLFIKEHRSVVRLQTVGPANKVTDLLPAISYQAGSTELGKADARSPTQPQISICMRLYPE